MLIMDVLRHKGDFVATLPPSATVDQLLGALAAQNIGAVVVCDDDNGGRGRVVGIVSERDVVRALHDRGAGLLATPIAEIMTREVRVVAPDELVESLMRVMTEARIRHVPVLTDDHLVGIVSIGDVVKSRVEQLESERESLIGYVSSGG